MSRQVEMYAEHEEDRVHIFMSPMDTVGIYGQLKLLPIDVEAPTDRTLNEIMRGWMDSKPIRNFSKSGQK